MDYVDWETEPYNVSWDKDLVKLNGHPLQSTLWEEARCKVDLIHNNRWQASRDGKVIWMAGFEERKLPLLGCVAWIPKGKTTNACPHVRLKNEHDFAARHCEIDICFGSDRPLGLRGAPPPSFLTPGREPSGLSLHKARKRCGRPGKQWRYYGVDRAVRRGVRTNPGWRGYYLLAMAAEDGQFLTEFDPSHPTPSFIDQACRALADLPDYTRTQTVHVKPFLKFR